jgi:hypothetical protein
MRRSAALLLLLVLASCGGHKERPRAISAPRDDAAATRQCLADLGRAGVRFDKLPDRQFGGGCSATGAVKLLDIGVPTTNLGAMRCGLARAFANWVHRPLQQAAARNLGSPVVRIESMGTYACRPVNNQSGGKLSEHGRANAVDLGAFVLADGRRITVKEGWNGPDMRVRAFLREIHRAACGPFGVVLGPDANAFHRDHLHFDSGPGPYCR